MANNSIDITKTSNHLSPEIFEQIRHVTLE